MTAAALPAAGLRPATLVLLDPPVLPLAFIAREASDPSLRTYEHLDDAIVAVTALQPTWSAGDVRANAEALVEVDADAARSVVLDNGDWDGGLADLRDPAAAGIDIWLIRGESATGGYVAASAVPAFEQVIGAGHVITIPGASHSPQRTMPFETAAAFLRALGEP
jgi:hypothetical protein